MAAYAAIFFLLFSDYPLCAASTVLCFVARKSIEKKLFDHENLKKEKNILNHKGQMAYKKN